MKIKDLEELEMYVFLLEDLYQEVLTDYNEIVKGLKKEFEIETTTEEISRLYEPTINEEIEDLKLIYNKC